VKLPEFKKELAEELAKELNIPIAPTEKSTGQVSIAINNLTNGRTITSTTQVVGSVQPPRLKNWKLEIGESARPTEWKTIGSGTTPVNNGVLGVIDVADLKDGVYTVRLSTDDGKGLSVTVLINVRRGAQVPGPGTPTVPGGPTPTPFTGAPPPPPSEGTPQP
jgi:hypothetical protein